MKHQTPHEQFMFRDPVAARNAPVAPATGKPAKSHGRKSNDFQRGAEAAASVAEQYNASSTHPYRLDDCILAKLNIRKGEPRVNRQAKPSDRDAWQVGFATALAEMHRRLLGGGDSKAVVAVARAAGLTIRSASAAGASAYDLKELKKAGVR